GEGGGGSVRGDGGGGGGEGIENGVVPDVHLISEIEAAANAHFAAASRIPGEAHLRAECGERELRDLAQLRIAVNGQLRQLARRAVEESRVILPARAKVEREATRHTPCVARIPRDARVVMTAVRQIVPRVG